VRTQREFLLDTIGRLNTAGVQYMLTGAMASNFWGIPRTTHDLDFVLLLKPEDADRLVAAFQGGFFIQAESVRAAFRPPFQFNVLDEQSALKADFWLLRDDPFEQTAFARRVEVALFGFPAWIATAEDVILHKLSWNRLTPSDRQLNDAAGVYVVQAETLDLAYLRRWAAHLSVEDTLEDLLAGRIRPKTT